MASGLSFSEFRPRSAGQMQGGAGAAENASVAENFSALRDAAPQYGKMGQANIAAESAKREAAMMADAETRANGVRAIGATTASRIKSDADIEAYNQGSYN